MSAMRFSCGVWVGRASVEFLGVVARGEAGVATAAAAGEEDLEAAKAALGFSPGVATWIVLALRFGMVLGGFGEGEGGIMTESVGEAMSSGCFGREFDVFRRPNSFRRLFNSVLHAYAGRRAMKASVANLSLAAFLR
jgi:hypothetical protein